MAVGDRDELQRLQIELHAHELAALHHWSLGKARRVIVEAIASGAHGFWEQDPIWYWDWSRKRDSQGQVPAVRRRTSVRKLRSE